MRAQVLYGVNQLRFEENYSLPVISHGEVLVKVRACGVCGSDVDRVLKNGTYHFPTIIGHEFSGEVVETADEDSRVWLGKRVSVFPLVPCMRCASCKKGEYQLCENYSYLGSRCDGGFAEYVAVPVKNLIDIPDGVPFEAAAMLEPCAVALHALKKGGSLLGRRILITGSGTIASILARIAMVSGAACVTVAARNVEKLAYIKEKVPRIITAQLDSLNGEFDVVVEGTGASSVIGTAMNAAARQGTVVLMGNPSGDVSLEKGVFWQILRKELRILGTWNSYFGVAGKNDWADALGLLEDGRLSLDDLITHRMGLESLMDGIMLMRNRTEIFNKIMVVL